MNYCFDFVDIEDIIINLAVSLFFYIVHYFVECAHSISFLNGSFISLDRDEMVIPMNVFFQNRY